MLIKLIGARGMAHAEARDYLPEVIPIRHHPEKSVDDGVEFSTLLSLVCSCLLHSEGVES